MQNPEFQPLDGSFRFGRVTTCRFILALLAVTALGAVAYADVYQAPVSEVVPVDKAEWGFLNPARGDKGPRAADLWGDRTRNVPSGILLKFPDNFSSPPHIHNISYRGIVIEGQLHNDDPGAAKMWLSAGSFWTQPAGEVHITAAQQGSNIAYIEIESGPYLVNSPEKAFDNGERPLNVDSSNIVWLDAPGGERQGDSNIKIAYLWGDPANSQPHGSLLKLPDRFDGTVKSGEDSFKAVVVSGSLVYTRDEISYTLKPGSYIGSSGIQEHRITARDEQPVILYIRSSDRYEVLISKRSPTQ